MMINSFFDRRWDMILDVLQNSDNYIVMNQEFKMAFRFLLSRNLYELAEGRYDIVDDRVYAMVSKCPGRRREEALLEVHEKYIDIQLILEGIDTMGWKAKAHCKTKCGEYDADKDVQFFKDDPDTWLSVKSGMFAIFFPEDAHMPMVSSGHLHKVVVKVAEAHQ
jgi:biofilm protein TabA